MWFAPNTFGVLRIGATPGKFGYFYSHLSLETVFAALKLAQKLLDKYEHIFFLKTVNLTLN